MTTMTTAELQKYWDACLIKQWRLAGTLADLRTMYKSIVGEYPDNHSILRKPEASMPYRIGVRVFVDTRLSKLNELLWKVSPEKDVEILKKLTASKYDTHNRPSTNAEREVNNTRYRHKKEAAINKLNITLYSERNSATDWDTVKSTRARVRRTK